ncbi:MAG: hypothetical protein DRP71_13235 [Verrucomicrobia bacterium]|nr:MAG: hypothetical protein DRP71_13235 [Verrucomicrobiota bacterium]
MPQDVTRTVHARDCFGLMLLWLLPRQNKMKLGALYARWTPDLIRDRFYALLETTYLIWHGALLIGLLLTGLHESPRTKRSDMTTRAHPRLLPDLLVRIRVN